MSADSKTTRHQGETALSRWSRRKLEARKEAQHEQPATEAPVETPPVVDKTVDDTEKPVLTDADMPDIDTLDENSDFSVFMSSGVSDKLRNLALRKLFGAPVFNIRDGLDEYDDDYTSFEKLGDIVTSDMKHQIEMQQQKLRQALAEEQQANEQQAEERAEPGEAEAAEDAQATDTEEAGVPADDKLARLDETPENPNHDAEENPQDER
ncbi:MAG TPA: DUF3306 domain-containing protein [Gammaproteobacteria bacterium]|nr:DUF3306 domain-containing protein [Gammaproteobacteria bacterium]